MTRIYAVEPRLPVSDVPRSREFYGELGFRPGSEPGSDGFLIMVRDSARIQLIATDAHHPPGPFTVWLAVDDVDRELARLGERVTIEWGPEDYEYGRREFAVLDPDGHRLIFSSPT